MLQQAAAASTLGAFEKFKSETSNPVQWRNLLAQCDVIKEWPIIVCSFKFCSFLFIPNMVCWRFCWCANKVYFFLEFICFSFLVEQSNLFRLPYLLDQWFTTRVLRHAREPCEAARGFSRFHILLKIALFLHLGVRAAKYLHDLGGMLRKKRLKVGKHCLRQKIRIGIPWNIKIIPYQHIQHLQS